MGLLITCSSSGDSPKSHLIASSKSASAVIDFNRDIRPILSKNCFVCHGADEGNRKVKLRLDVRDEATKIRKKGKAAIDPKHPEKSLVIKKITAGEMPPEESGNKLTPDQIETIKSWVQEGAPYAEHWAFVKPERPALPKVQNRSWPRNAIDDFILARLEKEGLHPSPEADRLRLLRRASLDLRGLPPSPDEIDAFAKDQSPDAYEKMIDRFLADPAFGERWARVWLDLARYADSAGYGSDPLRPNMWPYRDWVINAFNRNLPYDQFTMEQLAGDLLPKASGASHGPGSVREETIATAFHRNTMTNTEGGTDPEEYRVAAVKDRTITTMQVWMGLTMGCAQCHSHKYDPISQKDFYSFFAIFNQTVDANRGDEAPTLPTPTRKQLEENQRIDKRVAELRQKLDQPTPALAAAQAQWEAELRSTTKWSVLEPASMQAKNQTSLARLAAESIRASGPNPANEVYTVAGPISLKAITAVRLEAIPDSAPETAAPVANTPSSGNHAPTSDSRGSGRAEDGNFVLSQIYASVASGRAAPKPARGQFVRISLPGPGRILSLAEVEVFSGGENIARKGKASQSSTDFEGTAEKAIDGKTEGDFYKARSVTHTRIESDPWWEVHLPELKTIDRIKLWNRTDAGLQERLAGAHVQILDEKRKVVWEETVANPPQTNLELTTGGGQALPFNQAVADFSQDGFPVKAAIGGKSSPQEGWAVAPKQKEPHTAYFLLDQARSLPPNPALTITLEHSYHLPGFNLGRFRLAVTDDPKMAKRASVPSEMLAVLDRPGQERKPAEHEALARYFRSITPLLKDVRDEIAKLEKSRPAITNLPVMQELPAEKHRVTHLMKKGNFLDPAEVVLPSTPAAFPPLPNGAKPNRLGLANWLVSPDNPLTARVAVNRFWARLFGAGIVETEEDFGTQGELPSHPDLLDWLAVEYRDSLHWDTKAFLKMIVTSATYRQTSRVTPELLARDPLNRLLSRGPRYRLEAETIRDQALALSGLLAHKIGGPSVYPPQPDGLWQAAFNGERTWATSKGEDRYRRGLYTFWRRTIPYPSMAAFDAPSRETCAIKRVRSNTPVQAFVTLNDPVYVEAAQALARRVVKEGGGSPAERARFVLRLCLVREPEPEQVTRILELYQSELQHYRQAPAEAMKLATDPIGPLPSGLRPDEVAAWTVVANVVLNLDGVLTKG
jgi:hypothetical protein